MEVLKLTVPVVVVVVVVVVVAAGCQFIVFTHFNTSAWQSSNVINILLHFV